MAPDRYDFRRPSKIGRDVLRVFELGHETFTRRLGSAWGSELRATVQLDPLAMEQSTFDEHVRSMPNPNIVLVVAIPPLPGAVLIDVDVQLVTQLVERLMGASPQRHLAAPRRPSDVEAELIRYLADRAIDALGETLGPLVDVDPELESVEYNPQLLQVAAPSDVTLLLSYRATIAGGVNATGMVTVAYPGPALTPLLDMLQSPHIGDGSTDEAGRDRQALESVLSHTGVQLSVQLTGTPLPARDLVGLQVGDVLTLDHRVDQPARGVLGGHDVLTAHLGRRGSRRAVQVDRWHPPTTTTPVPTDPHPTTSPDDEPTDPKDQP